MPSQFADLDDAAEYVFDRIIANGKDISMALEAGGTVEGIARSVVFTGFTKGKFNPDLALLLLPLTMAMIVTVAKKLGVSEAAIRNPNKKKEQRSLELYRAMKKNKPVAADFSMELVEEPIVEDEQPSLGGLF